MLQGCIGLSKPSSRYPRYRRKQPMKATLRGVWFPDQRNSQNFRKTPVLHSPLLPLSLSSIPEDMGHVGVFGGCVGRVRNHNIWASVWHMGKEPVKTDRRCCFLALSQGHLGQSLKRSHSWTFCLALMLNFLLPHFFGWTFGTRPTAQYCILTTL